MLLFGAAPTSSRSAPSMPPAAAYSTVSLISPRRPARVVTLSPHKTLMSETCSHAQSHPIVPFVAMSHARAERGYKENDHE